MLNNKLYFLNHLLHFQGLLCFRLFRVVTVLYWVIENAPSDFNSCLRIATRFKATTKHLEQDIIDITLSISDIYIQLKHSMYTYTMKLCFIYLCKFFSEFSNVRHVENEVYGRVYYEHKVTKRYTQLYRCIKLANSIDIVSSQCTHQLIQISYNWEKLTKYKYDSHSKKNSQLLIDPSHSC